MPLLREARLTLLKTCGAIGLDAAALRTRWRRNRLLILGYHGVALDDEDKWDPELYMSAAVLRRRLEMIRESGCHVLALDDAVRLLYDGELPPRSVVLTFDDGNYDFYSRAFPIVEAFGYPVTVYFTTYYAEFNAPVYDAMVRYLLWKGRGGSIPWPEVLNGSDPVVLTEAGRGLVQERLRQLTLQQRLSGRDKDALLGQLAAHLDVDYDGILRRRLLHLMTLSEAASWHSAESTSSCTRTGIESRSTERCRRGSP